MLTPQHLSPCSQATYHQQTSDPKPLQLQLEDYQEHPASSLDPMQIPALTIAMGKDDVIPLLCLETPNLSGSGAFLSSASFASSPTSLSVRLENGYQVEKVTLSLACCNSHLLQAESVCETYVSTLTYSTSVQVSAHVMSLPREAALTHLGVQQGDLSCSRRYRSILLRTR